MVTEDVSPQGSAVAVLTNGGTISCSAVICKRSVRDVVRVVNNAFTDVRAALLILVSVRQVYHRAQLCLKSQNSLLDRVSTGSGSDLVKP